MLFLAVHPKDTSKFIHQYHHDWWKMPSYKQTETNLDVIFWKNCVIKLLLQERCNFIHCFIHGGFLLNNRGFHSISQYSDVFLLNSYRIHFTTCPLKHITGMRWWKRISWPSKFSTGPILQLELNFPCWCSTTENTFSWNPLNFQWTPLFYDFNLWFLKTAT